MLSFLDPFGLFGGGGGSSSSSVTSTVNLNVNGLNDMNSTVEVKPLELKPVTLNGNIDLKPIELKPVTMNANIDLKPIELKPVTVSSNIDLKPVTVNETFDLRPVAVDSCQTLRLAPLPATRICSPYRHHVGYTVFGVEWGGMTYEGESRQAIDSPRRPDVVDSVRYAAHRRSPAPSKVAGTRGLRVRLVDPDDH